MAEASREEGSPAAAPGSAAPGNRRASRPSRPMAVSSSLLTRPGWPASASGRSSAAAYPRTWAAKSCCTAVSPNEAITAPRRGATRRAGPDQLQPGPRPVGAAGLRLAAARGELVRPGGGRPGVALLRGGVQGPLRVVQVRPAQGAEVGTAGQQDRVDVVVGRDDADGDHRHTVLAADLVADPVRVRGLVAAAERRALVADYLPEI